MKTLKRILLVLLSLLMIFGLFSCKKETEGENDSSVNDASAISFLEYSVVYASGASEALVNEISAMHGKLTALSKKDNSLEADTAKAADSATKEILIGSTNRAESEQIKAELAINEFAVAVVGNKIVIISITDECLSDAIAYFSNTYLADGADGSVPKDLSHKDTDGTVCLVDRGEANYTFVRSYTEKNRDIIALMTRISTSIKEATNISLPVKDDYRARAMTTRLTRYFSAIPITDSRKNVFPQLAQVTTE